MEKRSTTRACLAYCRSISLSDHGHYIIIPGSFTGEDRVTIPFKDAMPLPTKSVTGGLMIMGDEYGHGLWSAG